MILRRGLMIEAFVWGKVQREREGERVEQNRQTGYQGNEEKWTSSKEKLTWKANMLCLKEEAKL